jgi:DNA-binding NarL/FixJ family response regulator
MKKARVLIIDADQVAISGLRDLVRAGNARVCATAANAEEGLILLKRSKADMVVCGINLPGMTGIEFTRRATAQAPGARVLLRGVHSTGHALDESRAAGAAGYVPKSAGTDTILKALRTIAGGGTFFGTASPRPKDTGRPGEFWTSRGVRLTGREREIVRLIAEGRTSKEIGLLLGISVKTVETHRSNLMRKLRVHSVSETVRYAIRHHYVVP